MPKIPRLAVAVVFSAGLLVSCGTSPGRLTSSGAPVAARSTTSAPVRVSYSSLASEGPMPALPAGFSRPRAIVGDPKGAGAWFLSESTSDVRVFHWNLTTKSLTSWSLGQPSSVGGLGIQSSLVVASDRAAWAGIGQSLFKVDPSTSQVSRIGLPRPAASSVAQRHEPAALRAAHNIVSLAVSPSGALAVARMAAAALSIVSPSGATTQLALPPGTAATQVAYDGSGALAVALVNYAAGAENELLVRAPGASPATVRLATDFVTATTHGFLLGRAETSSLRRLAVARIGTTTTTQMTPVPISVRGGKDRPVVGGDAVSAGGSVVYETASGLAVSSPTGATRFYSLAAYDCASPSLFGQPPPTGGASTTTTAASTVRTCNARATSVSTDHAGDIWFLLSGPGKPIGVLTPSQYRPFRR